MYKRQVFGVIVMTIAGVATYFVFLNLSVEFEYLFAEGGLSVDRIPVSYTHLDVYKRQALTLTRKSMWI